LATKIVQGISSRTEIIQSILDHVTIKTIKTTRKLQGLTFVITGQLSRPRKDIIDELQTLGAKISSSVTQNTNYLITNETNSNSSKFKTAQKLGIKIINENQLKSLLTQ